MRVPRPALVLHLSLWRITFSLIMGLALVGQALGGKSPSISSLSPTSGAVGTSVTVSGSNFGSSQGSSTITFNGVVATATSWKTGSIVATVPAAATTGPVVVKVSGTASNGVAFTVTPVISSLSPTSGAAGTTVAISGSGFGASQGSSTISFNGKSATPTSWNVTTIGTAVPSAATTGPVIVTVNGVASHGVTFTVPPTLVSIAVSPQNSSLSLGLSERLTATGTYSDSSTGDVTSIATWASLSTTVATVGTAGWTTSRSAGNTIITATYANVSASAPLTVTAPTLLSTVITPQNIFLPPGTAQQFTVTGTYSDGSTQNITGSVTWASSNTSVSTVNATGVATGVGAGTATITAAATGYTSATGVTVTSPGPPTITASVSPSPNSAGWNNTNVTVTFTCTPGGAAIVTCPSAQAVSSEGPSQIVSGTVTDSAQNNATASVTLNIDKTPPVLAVSSPTDGAVFTTSSIPASGTLSDVLSGLSSLTCNGTPVTPGASFSCNISLNPGLNLVVVRATDIAGNVSLTKMHVVLNVPLPAPLSLQITPANVSVVVGSSQPFTAVDDKGRPRTDATWTISNHTVATITSDASPWLTALAAGSATLTATVQGLSTQEQVTVLSGTASPGTASWTVPPIQTRATQLVSATPWIGGTPDLYDTEGSGSTAVLRAFTIEGQLLWQQSAANSGPLLSDAFGGLIGIPNSGGLIDFDGQTGTPVWQYSAQQGPLGGYGLVTLRPDGSILALESTAQNTQVYLDVFDGNTGARTMSIPTPQSAVTTHQELHCIDPSTGIVNVTITDGGSSGGATGANPVVIDENGNAYVEYEIIEKHDSEVQFNCNYNPAASAETGTTTVGLLELSSDGSISFQTVASSNWTTQGTTDSSGNGTEQYSGSIIGQGISIPDGQGGMLVGFTQALNSPTVGQAGQIDGMITHMSINGNANFQLPISGAPSQMVLGENGNAFASFGFNGGAAGIVSFDINSGAVHWTYNAPSGYVPYLIASSSGNGLAAQLVSTTSGIGSVIRFDPSGVMTSDSWSAVEIRNFGGSQWLGISGGALTAISAAPIELSAASWYAPDGNGGNAAKQGYSVSNFSRTPPNQTTLVGVAQEILDALPLATFPGSSSCYAWIQNGPEGGHTLSDLQTALSGGFWGHGTVNSDGRPSYFDAAITVGNPLPPGVTSGVLTVINDVGAFFNTLQPLGNNQFQPYSAWPRGYPGNDFLTQAQVSLHEMGHQVVLNTPWQNNDGNNGKNGKASKGNDALVDAKCGQMIRALPSINMPSDLPPGLLPGLSPASGSVGTTVTINGTNFGTTQSASTVSFNGMLASTASRWGPTQITVTVPSGAQTGNVVVTVSGIPTTGPIFTVQ